MFSTIGDKPFFGTCWAGVGEYVFPIPNVHSEGNSNYFSTVFRRMCGMSPREYRIRFNAEAEE